MNFPNYDEWVKRRNGLDADRALYEDHKAAAAYRPSAEEAERSEIQGDRIAMFRAEY